MKNPNTSIVRDEREEALRAIDVVIYHYPCNDGLAAFYVARRYANFTHHPIIGVPVTHGGKPIDESVYAGKRVLMVDIVTPDHAAIAARAASLVILDHHKTSRETCAGLPYAYFDESMSGVGLAWRFFNGVHPMPALLSYIQERDLFSFSSDYSRNVTTGLMADMAATCSGPDEIEKKLSVISFLIETRDLSGMEAIGHHLNNVQKSVLEDAVKKAVCYTLHLPNNTSVAAVVQQCIDPALISNLGAHLITNVSGIDVVVLWRYDHRTERYWYSLRSNDAHADASAIAAQFPGGGGHRNACGFEHAKHPAELFAYEQLDVSQKKQRIE